jgi:hypothetical protein
MNTAIWLYHEVTNMNRGYDIMQMIINSKRVTSALVYNECTNYKVSLSIISDHLVDGQ